MELLVTGLCLSRNLGGPAMALVLKEQIINLLPDIKLTFAIPEASYIQEKKWADYYGVNIVRGDNFLSNFINSNFLLLVLNNLYRSYRKKAPLNSSAYYKEIHNEFMEAFRRCDGVINMMGVSYIGDGVRGFLEGPVSYSNFHYSKKHNKPFIYFIQSFGPFDDWKVRLFAKRDLNQADFIPARGKESAKYCKSLIKNPNKVFDFPDSAIMLPNTAKDWAKNYLTKISLIEKNFIVLSPSSVIFNMCSTTKGSTGIDYVKAYYAISIELLKQGNSLIFLPHMYSDNKHECDREICFKIINLIKKNGLFSHKSIHIIQDDIDVFQAKSIISMANMAIVSRYHALVAAISTAVPVITLGWNVKYFDLMSYYNIENMAIDIRKNTPDQICKKTMNLLNKYNDRDYINQLKKKQKDNVKKVTLAFKKLENWLRNNLYK